MKTRLMERESDVECQWSRKRHCFVGIAYLASQGGGNKKFQIHIALPEWKGKGCYGEMAPAPILIWISHCHTRESFVDGLGCNAWKLYGGSSCPSYIEVQPIKEVNEQFLFASEWMKWSEA